MLKNADSERDLLDRLKSGDKMAFRAIYDAYYAMIFLTARRLITDREACRDLTQDLMVKLWLNRTNINIQNNLGGYLRRMIVNASVDFIEREKRKPTIPVDEIMIESIPTHESNLQHQSDVDNLETAIFLAIDGLPEKCRLVFSLSRFEKMTYRDIAECLGLSQKSVEKHISKALDILRRVVQDKRNAES